jgi:hypothetical protein
VQLTASREYAGAPSEFHFKIAATAYDLSNPPGNQDMFNAGDQNIVAPDQVTSNLAYDTIFDQNSDLVAALQSSLASERFTIGIVCTDEMVPGAFYRVPGLPGDYVMRLTIWVAEVTVEQKRESGSQLTSSVVGYWDGSSFTDMHVGSPDAKFLLLTGSREVLRGLQSPVIDPLEKYRVWERNQVEQLDTVQNHRGFTMRQEDASLTSRFHTTDPTITIKTNLIDLPGTTGGNIQFRDPWYIDFQDGQYGNNWRNRGMQQAQFYTRSVGTSGWQPDFTTTYEGPYPYNGVFLNQDPAQTPTYYSVGAPNPNTFTINLNNYTAYFQNWEGDPNSITEVTQRI